jgi:hypothetical protein
MMDVRTLPGPYAFPLQGGINQIEQSEFCGMTLRDYFAAKALAAMLANPNKEGAKCGKAGLMFFPGYAYEWADAMMKARQS